MTKLKRVLLVVLGLCIFTGLPLGHAQNIPGKEESSQKAHFGQRMQEIFSQLNLTEDQKKQLEANKKEHRAKMENAHQEMKIDKEALKNELMKPYLDMPRVKALHKQIKTLLSQMEDCKLNSILAVRGILSPEQFSKFVVLMQKHSQE